MRICLLLVAAGIAAAQPKPAKPFHADGKSSIEYTLAADGSEAVEIRNVSYEVTGTQVPGRPPDERLLLKSSVHSKQMLGDIGMEAKLTLEAWPFGTDPSHQPLYTFSVTGDEGHVHDNTLFVVARGLEETEWWSIYKLGSGQHLFDTYTPLLSFSISRDTVKMRYVGFEAPPDDATDARLKQPGVVGVLTYASEEKVIRELLLTCDDARQAALLRSYADSTRTLAFADHTLKLSISQNYPSPPNTVELRIPVRGDDLDLAHVQPATKIHASVWRR